jgi:hypothetical protein
MKPETGQQYRTRVVIEADAAQIGNPVILAVNAEPMQVFPTPVKGSLNVLVELSDSGLTGNQQAPPDRRTDPGQHMTQLIDRR